MISNWEHKENKLSRHFQFTDFKEAIPFVNRVAQVAEELNHHPDMHIYYNEVVIETWTHTAGKVTEKDQELAQKIDQL